MSHLLSAKEFTPGQLFTLFDQADEMQGRLSTVADRRALVGRHAGLKMASLFYEPSTRTRFSFESAALSLGAGVLTTEDAEKFSSAIKGETIEDSTRVIDDMADVIVMRHHQTGAVATA